jgi:hypothetical protein
MYERCGQIAGYTSYHQLLRGSQIALMEPWKFVGFKIPHWKVPLYQEPYRANGLDFDISSEDFRNEDVIESQNYGASLIETAFSPWMDLLDAIVSLNASRLNASRLERLVGVNTGKLSPNRAADYLNRVAAQLQNTDAAKAKQNLRKGLIQTVINHLIPIWGDSKGRLDISALEGNPNIDALEDIMFHVKRLGSALGVDPALLGFGEMLSGGLGDGGFFRISIMAAIKANMLRRAIVTGLEELFDIHVAYKYGKVFLPGQKPWRIMFNSLSSAMEREEAENRLERVNYATGIANLVSLLDPDGSGMDRGAYRNFIWTDILKVDEEKFAAMHPKKLENAPLGGGMPPQPPGAGNQDAITESATGNPDEIRNIVYQCLTDFYAEE